MPYYSYEARDKDGKLLRSQTFALNKQELIRILQREGIVILSVTESAPLEERYRRRMHKRIALRDLILFAKELAVLFENGVPIIESLDVTQKQMESEGLLNIARQIKNDLEAGSSFRDAIAKHQKVFGAFWEDMIEAGELSGQLPFVIRQIAAFLESRDELRKKTLNAFLYPALLLTLATFTIFVFIFRVVPIFEELFATFNATLPAYTLVVVAICNLIRHYFFIGAIAAVILAITVKKALSTKQGRKIYEGALMNTPLLGNLIITLALERFATTLGVLLKSGIPMLKALEVAVKSTQSVIFAERIDEAKVKIMAGLPLSDALQQTGLFPPLTIQLVLVGEKTGNFSGMLEEISKYYADVIETVITRFTTLIGPLVLIVMALVIGFLIIAMFLPIFKFATIG